MIIVVFFFISLNKRGINLWGYIYGNNIIITFSVIPTDERFFDGIVIICNKNVRIWFTFRIIGLRLLNIPYSIFDCALL